MLVRWERRRRRALAGDTGDFGDGARAIAGLWIATRLRLLREAYLMFGKPPWTQSL